MTRPAPWLVGLWVGVIVALARASDVLFTLRLNPDLSREQNPVVAAGAGLWWLVAVSIVISVACGWLAGWHWRNRPRLLPREPGLDLNGFVIRYYFGESRPRTDLMFRTPPGHRILFVLGLLLPAVMVFASLAINAAHWVAWVYPETRPFHNWWAGNPWRLTAVYGLWIGVAAAMAWATEWWLYRQTLSGGPPSDGP